MKKISILLIVLISLLSCRENERTAEVVKNEIFETKQKLSELEKEYTLLSKNNSSVSSLLKVRTIKVKKDKITHSFIVTGTAKADKIAHVTPESNGQIKKIHVKEGQNVKKGQLLISLNSSVLQNSITEVKKGLELAEILYKKQKKLFDQGVGKEIDYLRAKNQKESLEAKLTTLNSQLQMSQIRAPFSGIVDNIISKEGELASPGMRIIQLVNLQNMSIKADVSEKYISALKKGQNAKITFSAYPEKEITSSIYRTGNVINPTNRTFTVEVKFTNTDNKIKPNMIAELHLTDYTGTEILVPSNLIQSDKKGKYVYVAVLKNNKRIAKKKYIETKFTVKSDIVVKGLNDADLVITDGSNFVNNGIPIQIID